MTLPSPFRRDPSAGCSRSVTAGEIILGAGGIPANGSAIPRVWLRSRGSRETEGVQLNAKVVGRSHVAAACELQKPILAERTIWRRQHHWGTCSVSTVARTVRFSAGLRKKIAADAERCGRSFEAQVIALLRRHYGEDVDIASSPAEILALSTASFAEIAPVDVRLIERKLKAGDR